MCVYVSIGSAVAAKDLNLLKTYNITHVLAIGWNLVAYHENDFKVNIIYNICYIYIEIAYVI